MKIDYVILIVKNHLKMKKSITHAHNKRKTTGAYT